MVRIGGPLRNVPTLARNRKGKNAMETGHERRSVVYFGPDEGHTGSLGSQKQV